VEAVVWKSVVARCPELANGVGRGPSAGGGQSGPRS
jgi:hypothetical protein